MHSTVQAEWQVQGMLIIDPPEEQLTSSVVGDVDMGVVVGGLDVNDRQLIVRDSPKH